MKKSPSSPPGLMGVVNCSHVSKNSGSQNDHQEDKKHQNKRSRTSHTEPGTGIANSTHGIAHSNHHLTNNQESLTVTLLQPNY
jgi:hypothetical protein